MFLPRSQASHSSACSAHDLRALLRIRLQVRASRSRLGSINASQDSSPASARTLRPERTSVAPAQQSCRSSSGACCTIAEASRCGSCLCKRDNPLWSALHGFAWSNSAGERCTNCATVRERGKAGSSASAAWTCTNLAQRLEGFTSKSRGSALASATTSRPGSSDCSASSALESAEELRCRGVRSQPHNVTAAATRLPCLRTVPVRQRRPYGAVPAPQAEPSPRKDVSVGLPRRHQVALSTRRWGP